MPLVTDTATAKARLRLCRACEHYKGAVCSKCGCFMLIKTRWGDATCPVGKW